jgi:hypothetical protein
MPPEKKFPHIKNIRLTDDLVEGITRFRLAHRDGPHAFYMTEQEAIRRLIQKGLERGSASD